MNFQNKSVLVTGGAGFIGSHLVEKTARCVGLSSRDRFARGAEPDNRMVSRSKESSEVQG